MTRSTCFNYFMNRYFQGYCITVNVRRVHYNPFQGSMQTGIHWKMLFFVHALIDVRQDSCLFATSQQSKRCVIFEDVLQKAKKSCLYFSTLTFWLSEKQVTSSIDGKGRFVKLFTEIIVEWLTLWVSKYVKWNYM